MLAYQRVGSITITILLLKMGDFNCHVSSPEIRESQSLSLPDKFNPPPGGVPFSRLRVFSVKNVGRWETGNVGSGGLG